MALDPVKNFLYSTLASGIAIDATSMTVATGDGAKFPNPANGQYNLVIYDSVSYPSAALDPNRSIVRATALTGDTFTIQQPSSGNNYNGEGDDNIARAHNTEGKVYAVELNLTKRSIDTIGTELDSKLNLDQTTPQNITNGSPAFSEGVDMANDKYLKGKNYAGTEDVNIIKVNTDNEAEVGVTINTGTIEVEDDAGAVTIIDMGVTSASADGTEMSYVVKIDGNNLLKIYTESDGAGGVDTFKVQLLNKAVLTMEDSAGTTHTYTSDTDGSLIIS